MIRHLHTKESSSQIDVLKQQVQSMSCVPVGQKVYHPEIMVRAFEYFATSRALYNRLKDDYKLPEPRTLTRITSRVSKITDKNYVKQVFNALDEEKRHCILLFDEVYVKKMMSYHGGSVFGKAANNPNLLANAVLGLLLDCLLGGPSFLAKMIPVTKLTSNFLNEQTEMMMEAITEAGGTVRALICDNNRTNQALFRKIPTIANKPWRTAQVFLLYDYVHIIKNIRNNWLRERP